MVGAGFAMLALALYALFMVMGEVYVGRTRLLQLFLWAILLPYLANTAGWLMTELGRTPWVVFGLMRLEEAASTTVTGAHVLTTLVVFTLIYAVLMVADVYLLTKFSKAGPGEYTLADQRLDDDQILSLVGAQD